MFSKHDHNLAQKTQTGYIKGTQQGCYIKGLAVNTGGLTDTCTTLLLVSVLHDQTISHLFLHILLTLSFVMKS